MNKYNLFFWGFCHTHLGLSHREYLGLTKEQKNKIEKSSAYGFYCLGRNIRVLYYSILLEIRLILWRIKQWLKVSIKRSWQRISKRIW